MNSIIASFHLRKKVFNILFNFFTSASNYGFGLFFDIGVVRTTDNVYHLDYQSLGDESNEYKKFAAKDLITIGLYTVLLFIVQSIVIVIASPF